MPSYIGKPMPRVEDLRLVAGRGRFTDDLAPQDAASAYVLRSPHAHALIRAIDTRAAKSMPGVLAILTAADYRADGLRAIDHHPVPLDGLDRYRFAFTRADGSPAFGGPQPVLAEDRARFVGEPVAFIVAETLDQARDAAEAIAVEYEPLRALVSIDDAMAPDAPRLWPDVPSNTGFDFTVGDADATGRALAEAHLVLEHEFVNQRIVSCHMEPRAAFASYDAATGIYHIVAGSQGIVRWRQALADCLAVPLERIELICPDVGGGFGSRSMLHAEPVLAAWAARRVGRAVRWRADRSEGFITDHQGRDLTIRATAGFDRDGQMLALRLAIIANVGATPVSYAPSQNSPRIAPTLYRLPTIAMRVVAVVSNTTPVGPYRGAGRPEAMMTMERLLDLAARRLGLDRVEIRRRNLITKDELPYRSLTGLTYDSGDFHGNMAAALRLADWDGFARRKAASRAKGTLRGIGLANYVEAPVGAPREKVKLAVKPERRVTVIAGTQSSGQGHETSFAQVVADQLGVPFETIAFTEGDSRLIDVGGGSHSDRSMRLAGTILVEACGKIVAQARAAAAEHFATSEDRIDFADGIFRERGSNRSLDLFEIAQLMPAGLAADAEISTRIPAHPTGAAVCEVEIDPETGRVSIERYSTVDDVGQPINPLIVDGQVHGGIAQGVGQALSEMSPFDEASGQVVAGSFMDYAVPRADSLPSFAVELAEDPTAGNPLRVKGGGESGTTPAPAATINAVLDALAEFGIEHIATPATPFRVWQAIQEARERSRR
jgi:aerobic carbon-monoxide dehydrogenase large subunit